MKRFWGIRHTRWLCLLIDIHWSSNDGHPSYYDLEDLEQIRRGER